MIRKREHEFALTYVNKTEEYDAKATLFVTGKSIEQHKDHWKNISEMNSVELGAHTYSALRPRLLHTLFKWLFNSSYGPYLYQFLDIRKTINAFKKIGSRPKAWRTHGYKGDSITFEILEDYGFQVASDVITLGQSKVFKTGKLLHVGINVPPDDDLMKFYFEDEIERMKREGERIISFISRLIAGKKDIVLQLHPLSLKVLDEFKTFEKILEELGDHKYAFQTITEFARKSRIEDISYITRLARPQHTSIL